MARRTTYFNEGKKMDTVMNQSVANPHSSGGRGFGSKDILGAEPPVNRKKPLVIPPPRKAKPEALKQDGWAPL
jgi:hypothetical protein